MAIDAKQSFLSRIEHKCEERLTVADMARLMGIISDVLEVEMENIPAGLMDLIEEALEDQ